MVRVGSKVVRSVADDVRDPVAEMAMAKMVYGSQADKVIGERPPHPDVVALASGATTCGYDKFWAIALQPPELARDDG